MVIGAELDKQIYKEGTPTWGCKSGVLDFEDVHQAISDFLESCDKKGELWVRSEMIGAFGSKLVSPKN